MAIRNFAEGLVLVVLPAEPRTSDELQAVNKTVSKRCDFDVIIDFSRVEILTSSSLSNLMILQRWLRGCGHKLTLCNVGFATKCIFTQTGLDAFFGFADDKFAAAKLSLQPAQSARP